MTVRRKLQALKYNSTEINTNDWQAIKQLIKWLEETKIKHYAEPDRKQLINFKSSEWMTHFTAYLKDLGCPIDANNVEPMLDWILGYAIQEEYTKKSKQYNEYAIDNIKTENTPNIVADNPLDHLDFRSNEFKTGIDKIAELLNIKAHNDPLITLEACSKLIQARLHSKALEDPQAYILKGQSFPFRDTDLGFDLGDEALNDAAKILRLLYIQDLRNLQTRTNECIVAVQSLTANPKTDTKLGKVGK